MSLIIKIIRNGSSSEYLFTKPGPFVLGADKASDLVLDSEGMDGKVLVVKRSGDKIFIKSVTKNNEILLDSKILPFNEAVVFQQGQTLSFKDQAIQVVFLKSDDVALDTPPMHEDEFKTRLDLTQSKLQAKEKDLRKMDDLIEEQKTSLQKAIDQSQHKSQQARKLEVEVPALQARKQILSQEVQKNLAKNQDAEDQLKSMTSLVKDLEREERSLKDAILIQNMEYSKLQDQIQKLHHNSDKLRGDLQALEASKIRRERELSDLNQKYQIQHQEIVEEKNTIQKLLAQSLNASKEESKAKELIQRALKDKLLIEHETANLKEQIIALENSRLQNQQRMSESRKLLNEEEFNLQRLKEENSKHIEEGDSLKSHNQDLRFQIQKIEEKLSAKRISYNQIEFQAHEETRKIESLHFQIERASHHLKDLQAEEKNLELKMAVFREEALDLERKGMEQKRHLSNEAEELREKYNFDLNALKTLIEEERRTLSNLTTEQAVVKNLVEELHTTQRNLYKERSQIEGQVQDLDVQKSGLQDHIAALRREKSMVLLEKDKSQRELDSLSDKIRDVESRAKEIFETSKVEMENFKRDERIKIDLERTVARAEIDTLRQRTLMQAETEVRRMQDELQKEKAKVFKEVDIIRSEANVRLKDSTMFANERVIEAQEIYRVKEAEAEALMVKTRAELSEQAKLTQAELLKDLAEKKQKIKSFLSGKQESGLAHIQHLNEQHQIQLKKSEEAGLRHIEDLKRKEMKKITKIREEELAKHQQLRAELNRALVAEKEKIRLETEAFKQSQDAEVNSKKKNLLEQLNQQKARQESKWREELQKERDEFEHAKASRMANAAQAIMNVLIAENMNQGKDEAALKEKIYTTISVTIDGKDANAMMQMDQILNFKPENRKQALPVLQKYSVRFGIPAAIALVLLLDIGSVRTKIVSATSSALEGQKNISLENTVKQQVEWREKNTYSPEQTADYKNTLRDNILFTKDFVAVMDDEAFQNDWILKVHNYIVKDLELSEDVAINYISTESALIKDLVAIRKDIHPTHVEAGVAKMADTEKAGLSWMKEKFSDDKLAKFNGFRKDIFEKFHKEKFGGDRGVASEAKKAD